MTNAQTTTNAVGVRETRRASSLFGICVWAAILLLVAIFYGEDSD
jgi:hypothetical protein